MKRIILILLAVLMFSSCSGGTANREKAIKKFIEKQMELDSVTSEGTIKIKMGEQGGVSIPLKADFESRSNNTGNSSLKDDEYYFNLSMNVLTESVDFEIWFKDQTLYLSDGTSKEYYEITDMPDKLDFNPEDLYDLIIDNTEDVSVSKKGRNTIITVTPKQDMIASLLKALSQSSADVLDEIGEDTLKSLYIDDIVLTVDNKGYINNVTTEAGITVQGMSLTLNIDLDYSDFNDTKIPKFDPSEFRKSY